jgi:hypothetical protein
MTKITPDHLARSAYIYIRQSTADQLLHNAESRQDRRPPRLLPRHRQPELPHEGPCSTAGHIYGDPTGASPKG